MPSDYVARVSAFGATAYDAWKRARPANDFATMVPFLERAIDLGREYAEFFAPYEHVAGPLIDNADEGMTTASIRGLFAELRTELVPIVQAIFNQQAADDGCLRGFFGEPAQLDFGLSVVKRIGYDFDRGRLIRLCIPSAVGFRRATSELLPVSTRAMSDRRYSRLCTRPGMRSTSRASILHWKGYRSDGALPSACMRANLGSGKT